MARAPDFIGLGAPKAGTTWIYACLNEHPDICSPSGNSLQMKEIFFFNRDENWQKGPEWYESLFDRCAADKKVGEFSTTYLANPATPQRIHSLYPHARLIVALRNPIDRALSHYNYMVMQGRKEIAQKPFHTFIHESSHFVRVGYYAMHLRRYLQYFPKQQILVLIYEDIRKDQQAFIQQVYQFLEIDYSFVPSSLTRQINVSRSVHRPEIYTYLGRGGAFLRRYGLAYLIWLLKKMHVVEIINRLNTRSVTPARKSLSHEERNALYTLFRDEIGALEELIGRKLPEWHVRT
jgi:hypothetical protein